VLKGTHKPKVLQETF